MKAIEIKKILEEHKKWLDWDGKKSNNPCLNDAVLSGADLRRADLRRADLIGADLRRADLSGADLIGADLRRADLRRADLSEAVLEGADLRRAKGMVKKMGVMVKNYYYKRFNAELKNNGYQFKIGLNKLRDDEIFASDDRVLCSYPGFHFASKSWCELNYPDRPLEALIYIPETAKINEPWAADGKASADMIEIISVINIATKEDLTEKFRKEG